MEDSISGSEDEVTEVKINKGDLIIEIKTTKLGSKSKKLQKKLENMKSCNCKK